LFKKLNKWGVVLCLSVCFILSTVTFGFAAQQPIQVYVDGKRINFNNEPIIENGTTLVEFRPIFESLGLVVGWEGETNMITGYSDWLSLRLYIGSKKAIVNGRTRELPLAPQFIKGYTMIPLRFISEATDKSVKWDEQNRTINILTNDNFINTISPNAGTSSSNLLEIKTLKLGNDDFNFAYFDDDFAIGISQQADNDGVFKGYIIAIRNLNNSNPLKLSQVSCVGINKTSNSEIKPSNALYDGKLGAYKMQSNYDLQPNDNVICPIIFMAKDSVHAIKYTDYSHQVILDIPHVDILSSTTSKTKLTSENTVFRVFYQWMTGGLVSFYVPSSVKLLNCNIEYSNTTESSGTIYCTVSAKNRLGVPLVSYYYLNFKNNSFTGYGESDYPSSKYTKTNVDIDWINAQLKDYWI